MLRAMMLVFLACIGAASGQLPSLNNFAQASGGQAALADAVEGIGGLMQRFEQLQPQLGSLPSTELQSIAAEGQQLHGRFVELQERLRSAGGGGSGMVPASEESHVIGFHRDLALFVARVEDRLGIMGPVPRPQAAQVGGLSQLGGGSVADGSRMPPPGAPPAQAAAGAVTQATDRRLQAAMRGVVDGMQRFEALHPRLRNLPQQVFSSISSRGQKLHESFLVLQRRGIELSGDGGRSSQMSEAEAVPYAAQLEAFVEEQTAFVKDAEMQVQSSLSAGGQALGGGGVLGGGQMPQTGGVQPGGLGQGTMGGGGGASFGAGGPPAFGSGAPSFGGGLPPLAAGSFGGGGPAFGGGALGSAPGAPSFGGGAPAFGAGAPAFGSGSPNPQQPAAAGLGGTASASGGRVTPATDQRLSAVISRVVSRMQEFEAMKPQFSRLPQQVFSKIAQQGQELNDRFVALQQQGAAIAGDGSVTMLESDASSYASQMEAFFADQSAFVDEAKQAVQSGGSGLVGGNLGSASLGSGGSVGLGAASLGGGSSPGGAASFGGPGLGGASLGGPSSAGSFGGGSLGGPSSAGSFGGGSLGGPSSAGSFGGGSLGGPGSAGSFGQGSFGSPGSAGSFGGGLGGPGSAGSFGGGSFGRQPGPLPGSGGPALGAGGFGGPSLPAFNAPGQGLPPMGGVAAGFGGGGGTGFR